MQNVIRQKLFGLILILFVTVVLVKFPVFLEVVINSCTQLCGPSPEKPRDDPVYRPPLDPHPLLFEDVPSGDVEYKVNCLRVDES